MQESGPCCGGGEGIISSGPMPMSAPVIGESGTFS
jgi:hypothetical protein